jgi:threonylcarbamoyladenosine tRNA methylthiotransferase MtaB
MSGQVPEAVKKERVRRLIALADEMARAYRIRFLGNEASVLWETSRDGVWEGLTGTYIRVRAPWDGDLSNRLTLTKLLALNEAGLSGEVDL